MIHVPTFVKDKNGSLYLSREARDVKGCILVPQTSQLPATAVARSGTANGSSAPFIWESPTDSWTEIYQMIGLHSPAVADADKRSMVDMMDNSTYMRKLNNRPVLLDHVFGTNLNPFFLDTWAVPLVLRPQQTVQFTIYNPSTAGTETFYAVGEGREISSPCWHKPRIKKLISDIALKNRQVTPYWWTMEQNISTLFNTPGITIPAGGIAEGLFRNLNDVTLIITCAMWQAITTGVAGETNDPVTFTLLDSWTGQALSNQQVSVNTGAGNASFPHPFGTPLIIEPSQNVVVTMTNKITDATTDFFLTLCGVAVYTR